MAGSDHDAAPVQKTKPRKKGAKPVEIPIPTHKEVFDLMRSVTGKRPSVPDDSGPKQ
jgi:hypothetical protein